MEVIRSDRGRRLRYSISFYFLFLFFFWVGYLCGESESDAFARIHADNHNEV